MKLRSLLLFGWLTIYSLSTFAQTSPSEPLPLDPKTKIGKLPNGLTYYIRQNKKPEQKVELRLVVNVGSILEDDDQQGLAHMISLSGWIGRAMMNFSKIFRWFL